MDPLRRLASVQCVTLNGGCSHVIQTSVETWLQARAAVGRRLRGLILRQCMECDDGVCVLGGPAMQTLYDVTESVREKGVVEEVLVEVTD